VLSLNGLSPPTTWSCPAVLVPETRFRPGYSVGVLRPVGGELSGLPARLARARGMRSALLEPPSDSLRHRCGSGSRRRSTTPRQVGHTPKPAPLLLGHDPHVEARSALHQRPETEPVGPGSQLDCRNKSIQDRTELGTFRWSHLAKVQKMPSGLDDDRPPVGRLLGWNIHVRHPLRLQVHGERKELDRIGVLVLLEANPERRHDTRRTHAVHLPTGKSAIG
jgi:hypothetical protein